MMTIAHNDTKERILWQTNFGYWVFKHYLPYVDIESKKTFKSPFYQDSKPSCHIYLGNQGSWIFKDHGNGGNHYGDCFWFVAKLKGLDIRSEFVQVMHTIIEDMGLNIPINMPLTRVQRHEGQLANNIHSNPSFKSSDREPSAFVPTSSCSAMTISSSFSLESPKLHSTSTPNPFSCEAKPYSLKELGYWNFYGITADTLARYKVQSLKSYTSVRSSDRSRFTVWSSEEEPMYLYTVGLAVKVYRPMSKLRFFQAGLKSDTVLFGCDLLPTSGEYLLITGGEKDVMSLGVRGFPAVCFNSETSGINRTVLEVFRFRFRHILICYDVDETGKKASEKLVNSFRDLGVKQVSLPLSGTKEDKDVSDYFAMGHTQEDFRNLLAKVLK